MPSSLPSLCFQTPEAHTLQEKFTAGIQYCGRWSDYIPDKSHRRKESFTLTPSPNVQSTKAGHGRPQECEADCHIVSTALKPKLENASAQFPFSLSLSLDHSSSPVDWYSLPLGQVFPSGLPAKKSPSQTTQRIVLESPYPVKLSID